MNALGVLSPFLIDTNNAQSNRIDRSKIANFNGRIASALQKATPSFTAQFTMDAHAIFSRGTFSFHALQIPGFVGSLNDSLLVYGIGDRFLNDAAKLIEKNFQTQGRSCKVYTKGVNLIIALEGECPADINRTVNNILKNGKFVYEISLSRDIPNTTEGRNVKHKILEWARQNNVKVTGGRAENVQIDILTYERIVGGKITKGMPDVKLGSVNVPERAGLSPRQLAAKILKVWEAVKFNGFNGVVDLNGKMLAPCGSDALVPVRDVDFSKIDLNNVVSDFYQHKGLIDKAMILLPDEFSKYMEKMNLTKDAREYFKAFNETIFVDFEYNVKNEGAFVQKINNLLGGKEKFFVYTGDINGLSDKNREYGKQVGDAYLRKFYEIWKSIANEFGVGNVKIDVFKCAGGDEYGLIFEGIADREQIARISEEVNRRMNKAQIELPEDHIPKEEKELLNNKGIKEGKDGIRRIKLGEMWTNYSKAKGGLIEIGHNLTDSSILVDPGTNRRSAESINERGKTDAKEIKKLSNRDSILVVHGKKGETDVILRLNNFSNRQFSTIGAKVNFYANYFEMGAPNSGIAGKGGAIAYNTAKTAMPMIIANAGLLFVKEMMNEKGFSWENYGKNLKESTKRDVTFGLTYGSIKAMGYHKLATPGALGFLLINGMPDDPNQRPMYLASSLAGGLTFMGGMSGVNAGLSKILGYSTKTPGPWWIQAISFGAGLVASDIVTEKTTELYNRSQTARKIIDSKPVQYTGFVLHKTAQPLNAFCLTYSGLNLTQWVGKTFGWQTLANVAPRVIGISSIASLLTLKGDGPITPTIDLDRAIIGLEPNQWNLEAMFVKNGCRGESNGPFENVLYKTLQNLAELDLIEIPEHTFCFRGKTKSEIRQILRSGNAQKYVSRDAAVSIIEMNMPSIRKFLKDNGAVLVENYNLNRSVIAALKGDTPFTDDVFKEKFSEFNASKKGIYSKYTNVSNILQLPIPVCNEYIAYLERTGVIANVNKKGQQSRFGLMSMNYLQIYADSKRKLLNGSFKYNVRRGENLTKIVNSLANQKGVRFTQAAFNQAVRIICFVNGINDPGTIPSGRALYIPNILFKK